MKPPKSDVPIDRGWAWVIVTAAFMNLFILIGISKCFGIIFAELIDIYHGSASETSIMLALSAGLSLFLAPLVTMASDRYTCRIVSMTGGLICCLGFLIPAYCTTLEQIIFSFGILTGVGYCICLVPCTIIVGRYFERHRSLANGLVFSGSGAGGMVIPLLLSHIISRFGLDGALLILAGLAFQTVAFSALYRPIGYWTRRERSDSGPEIVITDTTVPPEDTGQLAMQRRRFSSSVLLHKADHQSLRPQTSVTHLAEKTVHPSGLGQTESKRTLYFSAMNIAAWVSWPEIQEDQVSYCDHAVQTESTEELRDRSSSRCWRCYVKADDGSALPLFDLRLLRNGRFVLFIISSMFVLASVYIGVIIPAHCEELGMTKMEVAILLSVQGGADTAGRLLTAFLGDRPFVKSRREALALICCLTCTASTMASVFLTTFWGLVAYLIICSIAVGAYVASIPVVLVDLVGIENLSRAWGLALFLEGFSVTLSPLIIGALRDWTFSYISGLIYIDLCFALATCCMLLVVCMPSKGSHSVPAINESQQE